MGVKVKAGMYCETCDKPIQAQKYAHAIRNTISTVAAPVTGGLSLVAARVEGWHCPTCGGAVMKLSDVEREKKRAAKADVKQQQAAERAALATFGVQLTAFPKPEKGLTSGGNIQVLMAWREVGSQDLKLAKEQLTNLPAQKTGLLKEEAEGLVAKARGLGAAVEMIEPESPAESPEPDVVDGLATPPDDGVLDQIRKLGELKDAGVLTDEEFASKKADLLSRL